MFVCYHLARFKGTARLDRLLRADFGAEALGIRLPLQGQNPPKSGKTFHFYLSPVAGP